MATVLIIDDSPTQLMMYKMAIQKDGHTVLTSNNGIDGINLAYSDLPDIIISDIVMPEINGYVLCRLLKNDGLMTHIPIILLSSLGQEHDRFWGMEAGADAYIVKDSDTSRLIKEIDNLLAKRPEGADAAAKVLSEKPEQNNIRGKIYEILDRLLFEYMVSNKIREIFKFAYNSVQLFENFFELLHSLITYNVAAIALKTDFDNFLIFDIKSETNKSEIEKIMRNHLKGESPKDFQLEIFNRRMVVNEGSDQNLLSEIVLPLIHNNKWHGFISVHSEKKAFFDDQTEKILKISAKELTNVIQIIAKMKEIDAIKADFASMAVYDLNKPLAEANKLLQDMLVGKIAGELNDEQKEGIKASLRNITQAMDISEDISGVMHKIYSNKL
jgi:DNA-binding response OmpR family regulator